MRTVDVPDAETFSLDFEFAGILLSGVVMDKDTEQPIANASVYASRGGNVSGQTGPDGRFQMDVDTGEYRVGARAEGYGNVSPQDVTVGASGATDVRIVLARGLPLRGRVLDTRGRPAGSIEVAASTVEPDRVSRGATMSLADGSFVIEGLEARPYVVFAGSRAGGGYGMAGPVSPGDRDLVVRLRTPGRVRVTVRGPDGELVKDARTYLTLVDGHRSQGWADSVATDESGVAALTTMPGTLQIEARKLNLNGKGEVAVTEGGTASLEIRLAVPAPPKSP